MKTEQIFVYPIKSFPGIELNQAIIDSTGLKNDRTLTLIDPTSSNPENNWVTLRQKPELYLFTLSLVESILTIGHKNSQNTVELNLNDLKRASEDPFVSNIWDDIVQTSPLIETEVNNFISSMLGNITVQLAAYHSRTIFRSRYNLFPAAPTIQDGFPISIANQASLRELETSQYTGQIDIRRFRPNIIYTSPIPFDENNIQTLQIGNTQLNLIEGIPRCNIINVDNHSGQKLRGNLVSSLVQINNVGRPDAQESVKPRFGMGGYVLPRDIGKTINVNDKIIYIKKFEL
jgi:uncharacterized protein